MGGMVSEDTRKRRTVYIGIDCSAASLDDLFADIRDSVEKYLAGFKGPGFEIRNVGLASDSDIAVEVDYVYQPTQAELDADKRTKEQLVQVQWEYQQYLSLKKKFEADTKDLL